MKKVYQDKFSFKEEQRDGIISSLSSFLEIPKSKIKLPKNNNFLTYLKNKGYSLDKYDTDPNFTNIYLAFGNCTRGYDHLVLYEEGQLLHDPHPSQDGLNHIEGYYSVFKKK